MTKEAIRRRIPSAVGKQTQVFLSITKSSTEVKALAWESAVLNTEPVILVVIRIHYLSVKPLSTYCRIRNELNYARKPNSVGTPITSQRKASYVSIYTGQNLLNMGNQNSAVLPWNDKKKRHMVIITRRFVSQMKTYITRLTAVISLALLITYQSVDKIGCPGWSDHLIGSYMAGFERIKRKKNTPRKTKKTNSSNKKRIYLNAQ